MDYTNWPQIQQNPNPNPEYPLLQIPNQSVGYPQNLASNPYQLPNADPHSAWYRPPQPQPPGVGPPFVPPPGAVSYLHQPIVPPPAMAVSYAHQPIVPPPPVAVSYAHQPIAFEAQQGVDAAAAAAAAAAYYSDPNAAAASASHYADPNASWVASTPQFVTTTSQAAGVSAPNLAFQPETSQVWRKLPKKTKAVQSAWCEVCKINCNSKDVLDQHKLGKKHLKNLQKLQAPTPSIVAAPTIAAPIVAPPTVAAPVVADPSSTDIIEPTASIAPPSSSIPTSTSLPAPAPTPTPPSTDKPFIGPQPKSKSKSKKSRKKTATRGEDLDTKRRKVLEGGAAANAVRICSICNVICNSDTVFNYHIAGQKHATMAKKLAAGGGV